MDNNLMFSSANQQWATRWEVFDQLEDHLGVTFDLDPCAQIETAKCERFFTKEDDMFSKQYWGNFGFDELEDDFVRTPSKVFMNPPYQREQVLFVKELLRRVENFESDYSAVLIPARVDTQLFHKTILPMASCVTFYEGRLVFGTDAYWEDQWETEFIIAPDGTKKKNSLFGKHGKFNAAPFPSMVVEFTEESVLSTMKTDFGARIATLKAPKFKYQYCR